MNIIKELRVPYQSAVIDYARPFRKQDMWLNGHKFSYKARVEERNLTGLNTIPQDIINLK